MTATSTSLSVIPGLSATIVSGIQTKYIIKNAKINALLHKCINVHYLNVLFLNLTSYYFPTRRSGKIVVVFPPFKADIFSESICKQL